MRWGLSYTLAGKGVEEIAQLTVDAVAALEEAASGFRISLVDLDVSGEVSGMSQEEFGKAIEEACPVSNAIRNNVEVRLRGPAVVDGG